jgi:hypothetical protein
MGVTSREIELLFEARAEVGVADGTTGGATAVSR